MPIAELVVERYLDARLIDSRYTIEALSPRRIVLSRLVLGPATRPDLIADRVFVDVAWRNGVPTPIRLSLERPVLHVRLTRGGVSFGSLDALITKPTAGPFRLPNLELRVAEGQLLVATAAGPLRASIDAAGFLPSGFHARLTLLPADLHQADCRVDHIGGHADIRIVDRVAVLAASLATQTATCANVRLNSFTASLRARTPEDFDRIDGRWSLRSDNLMASAGSSALLIGDGRFEAIPKSRSLTMIGDLHARSARLAYTVVMPTVLAQTPLGPFAVETERALTRAARQFDLAIPLRFDWRNGEGAIRIGGVDALSASGARLRFVADEDLALLFPSHDLSVSGRLTLTGGGLPTMIGDASRLHLVGESVSASTQITIAPWQAGRANLAVPHADLAYVNGQLDMHGIAMLSGPLGDGRVEDLRLPLELLFDMRDGFSVSGRSQCLELSFDQLVIASIAIGRAHLPLCADGPLLRIDANGRLSGGLSIGRTVLGNAQIAGFHAAWAGTTATPMVAFRLDQPSIAVRDVHIGFDTVTGRLQGGGAWSGAGRVSGGMMAGLMATFTQADADWQLMRDGAIHIVNGVVAMRDTLDRPRFAPLKLADVNGVVRDGMVTADAEARLLADGDRLGHVRLRHDLDQGTGGADLIVDTLRFSDTLQPYEITELARGVVEEVKGPVSGMGYIRWGPGGITSEGRFVIDNVSLATAALGPVTGIKGVIQFNDLLALTSPPGQTLTIASLNPGILVENGTLRFQLLPDYKIGIAGAEWPFAGGTLRLDSTIIDATTTDRRYVLRVEGLDAATFMQQFEFKNFNVTGRFDGTLPLVFDATGGRIIDGRLTARAGGGLVQYVGEVGKEQMGAAARLAFDALKRLRYDALTIGLNGELDGELVTDIRFSGVNEAPVQAGGVLPVAASGLPFRFNVTIRAPFQRLLSSAASFGDARDMIRSGLPVDVEAVPGAAPPH